MKHFNKYKFINISAALLPTLIICLCVLLAQAVTFRQITKAVKSNHIIEAKFFKSSDF